MGERSVCDSIVLTVCEECGVTAKEFFGPGRRKKLTDARRIAIDRLRAQELSYRVIGRLIRRNYKTVKYWLSPSYRAYRAGYMARYHKVHPKIRHKWLSDEQKRHLLSVYLTEGFCAAKPIAIQYGVNPRQMSRYARAAGIKGFTGRPRTKRPSIKYHEVESALKTHFVFPAIGPTIP